MSISLLGYSGNEETITVILIHHRGWVNFSLQGSVSPSSGLFCFFKRRKFKCIWFFHHVFFSVSLPLSISYLLFLLQSLKSNHPKLNTMNVLVAILLCTYSAYLYIFTNTNNFTSWDHILFFKKLWSHLLKTSGSLNSLFTLSFTPAVWPICCWFCYNFFHDHVTLYCIFSAPYIYYHTLYM